MRMCVVNLYLLWYVCACVCVNFAVKDVLCSFATTAGQAHTHTLCTWTWVLTDSWSIEYYWYCWFGKTLSLKTVFIDIWHSMFEACSVYSNPWNLNSREITWHCVYSLPHHTEFDADIYLPHCTYSENEKRNCLSQTWIVIACYCLVPSTGKGLVILGQFLGCTGAWLNHSA